MRKILRRQIVSAGLMLGASGAMMQIGGCSPSGLANYIGNFNPCGSVLNCDPLAYNFLTSNYRGPGANPEVDIACSYPPFCDPEDDPFVGNLNGGGG